jgi:hypothetical protein
VLTADTERGFIARFAILAVALLIAPWLVNLAVPETGMLRFGPAVTAAALVVIPSIRRPREALLAFALFVLFYDTLARYMGPEVRRFDEMSVPGLALVGVFRALPDWRRWLWWPRELAIGLAVLAGIISSLANGVALEVWGIQLALLVKGIVIFYVALWTSARLFEITAGMKVVLTIGALILALGVIELFNPPIFQQVLGLQPFFHARGPLYSVKSLFFHPVLFSWFTAFIALYAYAWYLVGRRRLALVVAALFSLGPFLGQRRRAILALIVGLVAAFGEAMIRRGRADVRSILRRFAPAAAAMVLILVLFIPMLTNLYNRTLVGYVQPPSLAPGETVSSVGDSGEAPPQVRIALYIGSFEIARDDFPLGGGLGRWGSWMSRQYYSPLYYEYNADEIRGLKPTRPVNATDTFWPQILGELGVLGFLAYVAFMACLAIGLWRAAGRYRSGILRIFTLGTGMILAQALIESLASPMFHSPPRAYLVYLVVGVATALYRAAPDDWQEPDGAVAAPPYAAGG